MSPERRELTRQIIETSERVQRMGEELRSIDRWVMASLILSAASVAAVVLL